MPLFDAFPATVYNDDTDQDTIHPDLHVDLNTAMNILRLLRSSAEEDAAFQPLDSDLTAIAALTTTTFGRSLLALANQAALDALFAATFQPLDADLTAIAALTTTTYGRAFLALANAGAARTALEIGGIAQDHTQVNPISGGIANTNWDTPTQNNGWFLAGALQSSGAQNAEVSFDVFLSTGTWRLDVLARHSSDAGIAALTIDGTAPSGYGGSADTIDFYSGVSSSVRTQITGIAISTPGVKRLRLLLSSKNASSSSYFGRINLLSFLRTGA